MLGKNKREAINALINGASYEQAAEQAGIHERTLYRWLEDPEFRQALEDLDRKALEGIAARLTGETPAAIDVLAGLAAGEDNPPGVRRGAARDLLDLALRYREARTLPEIEKRLAALEGKSD